MAKTYIFSGWTTLCLIKLRERERMVNPVKIYKPLLRATMRLAGLRPEKIEVESGTVMNIWAPTRSKKNANNGKKPAVVFPHGFVGDGILTWQLQVLALARDYAVYAPDLLFFGGSSTGNGRRTVGFQAECLARGWQSWECSSAQWSGSATARWWRSDTGADIAIRAEGLKVRDIARDGVDLYAEHPKLVKPVQGLPCSK
ncbi:uncharacterized protein LOC120296100 [Eucalyptus grandis]|uniref:uncharacterized protein LOC120296100 n=1 Tax=Eucalyptus grandis TaxID=71139 RepID=UPI00192F07AC|nr:uncharacterized protein LOC120296100 [Eucalyptus grandis]